MKRRAFFALLLAPFFKKYIHFKEGAVIEWTPASCDRIFWVDMNYNDPFYQAGDE